MRKTTNGRKIQYKILDKFLGTSIIPIGLLKHNQLSKMAQSLANYNAKKDKIKEQIKNSISPAKRYELKNELDTIKLVPVELRVSYVPFTRENPNKYTLEEAFEIHAQKVLKEIEKIKNKAIKDKIVTEDQFEIETVDSFKKGSYPFNHSLY